MKHSYDLIISLLLLAVFSLTAAQSLTLIKNSVNVLGETNEPTSRERRPLPYISAYPTFMNKDRPTPTLGQFPTPTTGKAVPCSALESPAKTFCRNPGESKICDSLVENLKKYCGFVAQVTPTRTPPTGTVCKSGVNSFSVGPACAGKPFNYGYATFTCYDGFSGTVGDTNNQICTDNVGKLIELAQKACAGHSNCNKPTPTKTN